MNKLVSIILPTYNGASRIKEAILSVLAQSYQDWELLVIDDGSTDDTEKIVSEMFIHEPKIKYFKNEKNLGIQKTLNLGIKEAKGEYIARIDDDDAWIDVDKLRKQVEFLEKNEDYVLVGTGVIAVDENGQEIFRRINPRSDMEIRSKILKNNCFVHSSVLFRKDACVKCFGYSSSEEVKHVEDYDLWLKMGKIGKFANLDDYSVKLFLRSGSISAVNKVDQLKKSIKLIRKFKDDYPSYLLSCISLSIRVIVASIFKLKIFKNVYNTLYTFYKNI